MLLDPLEKFAVSCLGWLDRGALWVLDTHSNQSRTQTLSDAKYLELHAGYGRSFSVVHHFDDGHIHNTAHSFDEPAVVLSRCIVERDAGEIQGAVAPWADLPRYYVAYVEHAHWKDFALIVIEGTDGVTINAFDWYNDSYDKGYQGVIGAVGDPNSDDILVSVQRSSRVVVCSARGSKTGEFNLVGNQGNPKLSFLRGRQELWADDYDTLVVLDPKSRRVRQSRRLQDASLGTAQFIGQFTFTADEAYCAVARPFSGDVLVLDPDTLETRFRAELRGQPLEVAMLCDRRVFARDWKTGDLLYGVAKRAWFA